MRRRRPKLIAVPDDGGQLSEGLVVEASVVARLLGIRLLAIEANLVVAPAHVQGRPAAVMPPRRARAIGGGLAAADRFLSDGAASLAASRLTPATSRARAAGPAPPRP